MNLRIVCNRKIWLKGCFLNYELLMSIINFNFSILVFSNDRYLSWVYKDGGKMYVREIMIFSDVMWIEFKVIVIIFGGSSFNE